jgi:hypothetical protein
VRPDTFVAFVVLAAGLTFGTVFLKRYWSQQDSEIDRPPPAWLFGGDAWRTARRIMPISIVGGWLLIAAGVLMLTTPSGQRTPLAAPLAAALLITFILIGTIWMWNQPKFLVPPHLRNAPGILTGVLRARRRRGPSSSDRS